MIFILTLFFIFEIFFLFFKSHSIKIKEYIDTISEGDIYISISFAINNKYYGGR